MKELIQDGDYIIATRNDRSDFDNFRDMPFYRSSPIIATRLLLKYMKHKGFPIKTITEFGNVYVTSMPTETYQFDELCKWARKEINNMSSGG